VVTDTNAVTAQTLDYYPYGSIRINSGTNSSQRKFIGEEYDNDTNLSYLNARYYEGARGQFLSEDPTHLAIGDNNQIQQITGRLQQLVLADPQLLNSYSYGRDNPINNTDKEGKAADPVSLVAAYGVPFVFGLAMQTVDDVMQNHNSGMSWANSLQRRSSLATYAARGNEAGMTAAAVLLGGEVFGGSALITSAIGGLTYAGLSVKDDIQNNRSIDQGSAVAKGLAAQVTLFMGTPIGAQALGITNATNGLMSSVSMESLNQTLSSTMSILSNLVVNLTNEVIKRTNQTNSKSTDNLNKQK
jgi:RHS repeat-associated protein